MYNKKKKSYNQGNIDLCADKIVETLKVKTIVCYLNNSWNYVKSLLFMRLLLILQLVILFVIDNNETLGYIYDDWKKFKCYAL